MSKKPTCIKCNSTESLGYKYINKAGWLCEECLGYSLNFPSFEPSNMDDDRAKYFNSLVQPYREGQLSKEYVDAHPDAVKDMVKEGTVTQKEVDNAKNVWKDLPGHSNRKKSL